MTSSTQPNIISSILRIPVGRVPKHKRRHKLIATCCVTHDSFVNQICDFEHTSSIENRLYIPSDYVYSEDI